MTVTPAQAKATAKYKKNKYSRIPLDVPKEYHEYIKARAKQDGQSVNSWIKQAIDERAERVAEEIPPEVVQNLKSWLLNNGHTLDDFLDCLQYLGKDD